jgi:hypothetical protein
MRQSIFCPDCSQNYEEAFNLCAAYYQGGPTNLYEFTSEFCFPRLSEDASKCYRLGLISGKVNAQKLQVADVAFAQYL